MTYLSQRNQNLICSDKGPYKEAWYIAEQYPEIINRLLDAAREEGRQERRAAHSEEKE